MLYSRMIVAHRPLSMDEAGHASVREALATVFGRDRREEALSQSILFGEDQGLWRKRVCFGSIHQGSSMLCWRNRSTELQVHVETTEQVRVEDACTSAMKGIWQAFADGLDAKPRLERLEVVPAGDNKPVLIGRADFRAHALQRATIEPVGAALTSIAIVGFGGWYFWPDEAATLWIGVTPIIGLALYATVVAVASALTKRIRWHAVS